MDRLIGIWEQPADRRAEFLRCYRLMTGNMLLAIDAREFHDGRWVGELLNRFADYYFEALDNFENERPATPLVWSIAHRTANQTREGKIVQNLLLGINAHINYDLVLTLYDLLAFEWASLNESERQRRYEDHTHVNVVIAKTIDQVQDDIVEAEAPYFDIFDKLLGPLDEWSASRLIRIWREEVWQHAQQMIAARDEDERELVQKKIEAITVRRANVIIKPFGLPYLGRKNI